MTAVLNGRSVTDDEYIQYAINQIAHCTDSSLWYDYHYDFWLARQEN